MTGNFVRAQNLSVSFGKTEPIVDLSFSIPQGRACAFLGPNGAGKSTFIRTLINDIRPKSGKVELFGVDSRHLKPDHFASLGYVSADQKLPAWMTVEEFLGFLAPFYKTWDRDLENEILALFELPRSRKLSELSRGMYMKLCLCASMAYRPAGLILDEAFSGLDSISRDELRGHLVSLSRPQSLLFTTHEVEDLDQIATDIIFIRGGNIAFQESVSSLVGRYRLIESPEPPRVLLPDTWRALGREREMHRFVETRYEPDRFPSYISGLFSASDRVWVSEMPLSAAIKLMVREGSNRIA